MPGEMHDIGAGVPNYVFVAGHIARSYWQLVFLPSKFCLPVFFHDGRIRFNLPLILRVNCRSAVSSTFSGLFRACFLTGIFIVQANKLAGRIP